MNPSYFYLSKILAKLLDLKFSILSKLRKKGVVKHLLLINWDGKFGDAIVSAPLIDYLVNIKGIKVSVITNKPLSDLYVQILGVHSVYEIKMGFGLVQLFKAALRIRKCDAVVPLFGKLGIYDVIFILLIWPKLVFSTDHSLRMSNKKFLLSSENKNIDELYESIASVISGNSITLNHYSIPIQNKPKVESYDYLVNPFGSRSDKSLSIERAKSLILHLINSHSSSVVGVLYSPSSFYSASMLVKDIGLSSVRLVSNISSIQSVIPIIRDSKVLISVDTSLVHISRLLKSNVVAIYPRTKYFNIWLPSPSSHFEVVYSEGKVDYKDNKDMNQFDDASVVYALNRIKNKQRLENKKLVFLYWHSSRESMPIGHALNIKNLENRLEANDWEVILTTSDEGSPDYIENYICIPLYFHDLLEKTRDKNSIYGNYSDIVRLRLLECYGGIYLDTSTIFLRNDFSEVLLYKRLLEKPSATLAGYTNVTFTRKDIEGKNYFEEAKDGIELGVLYAKKASRILEIFNKEIDKYWNWKTIDKDYRDYSPFKHYGLGDVSFLNEYHIHYSIYHLIITRQPELLSEVLVQSMHMKGKETSKRHGPYAISDLFCRGASSYEPASPETMLQCFVDRNLNTNTGKTTSLEDRAEICNKIEFLVIPGYLRKLLEREFTCLSDFSSKKSLYSSFYRFLTV
jgi:ADP-heptose:LPS heptosyltransferase